MLLIFSLKSIVSVHENCISNLEMWFFFQIVNKQLQLLGIPLSYVALVLEYFQKFWFFFFSIVSKQLQLLGIPPSYVALVLEQFRRIQMFFFFCNCTQTAPAARHTSKLCCFGVGVFSKILIFFNCKQTASTARHTSKLCCFGVGVFFHNWFFFSIANKQIQLLANSNSYIEF